MLFQSATRIDHLTKHIYVYRMRYSNFVCVALAAMTVLATTKLYLDVNKCRRGFKDGTTFFLLEEVVSIVKYRQGDNAV
jgi:hypothetical protein